MDLHPLKAFRQRQKPEMPQEALAQMLGVSKPTISRWETGERQIEPEKVSEVAEKTGIPAADLRPDLAALFSRAAE